MGLLGIQNSPNGGFIQLQTEFRGSAVAKNALVLSPGDQTLKSEVTLSPP